MPSLDRLLSWQTDEELTPCLALAVPQVGVAKLNSWAAKYTIAGDSSVRKAIVDALQTETEDDSEVLLNLNAVSDSKVETPLGEGSIKLEELLKSGKDYKGKIVPVRVSAGAVEPHTFTLTPL